MPRAGAPRAKIRSSRYGRRIRRLHDSVQRRAKVLYKCPKCGARRVRMVRLGIWKCGKCGFEYAGGAWMPRTSATRETYASLAKARSGL